MSDNLKKLAKIIAIAVRNEMEDFHCKHLSDEQMKELNPIIRNAIYTALYASTNPDKASQEFVLFQSMLIPSYWEEPKLTEEFKKLQNNFK